MGNFTHTKNVDMHYMYAGTNGKGTAVLRMRHAQFPYRRMQFHSIFQWLPRQLLETHSFDVTKQDAGRRKAVRTPSLEESILRVVAVRPESSTRADAHNPVQVLNLVDYLLRLPLDATAMCIADGLCSSCAE
ncbi:uncharacterized protein TNCV_4707721 [Trichonephila clavipes]|nr:uncharacterized protein TNCV_4707721 [Trichonephila clavipes]